MLSVNEYPVEKKELFRNINVLVKIFHAENDVPMEIVPERIVDLREKIVEELIQSGYRGNQITERDWEYELVFEKKINGKMDKTKNLMRSLTLFLLPMRAETEHSLKLSIYDKQKRLLYEKEKKFQIEFMVQPFLILLLPFNSTFENYFFVEDKLIRACIKDVFESQMAL